MSKKKPADSSTKPRIPPLVMLVIAVAAPIALFWQPGKWLHIPASVSPPAAGRVLKEDPAPKADARPVEEPAEAPPVAGPPDLIENAPILAMADVLRFDVTPDWVLQHWPRVSAGLAHLPLQGYRVPLVTGTGEDDLAGALTYYFNPRQQLQRITFQGTTGNARELVDLLRARFGFARRLTNDPGVFVYETPGGGEGPESSLWIRPARVVKATDPYRRFEVRLSIERPEPR